MQFWAGAFTVTINARILNLPVRRYFRYLLNRTHRVLRPTDEPVENRNQINNLVQSGSSQLTDSGERHRPTLNCSTGWSTLGYGESPSPKLHE